MSGLWERFRNAVTGSVEWGIRSLSRLARDAVDSVSDLIGDQLGELIAWLGDAVDGIVQLVLTPVRKAWDLIGPPLQHLFGWLGDLGDSVVAAVRWVTDVFIPSVRRWLLDRVDDIARGIRSVIDGVRRWATDRLRDLVNGLTALRRWVEDHVLAPLGRLVTGLRDWVTDRLRDLIDGVNKLASWVHDEVLVPLGTTLGNVVNLIQTRIMAVVQLVEAGWSLFLAVAKYGPAGLLAILLPGRIGDLFGRLVGGVRGNAHDAIGALDDLADQWLR